MENPPPRKYVSMTDPLYDYVVQHRSRVDDPLLEGLRAETEALGDVARMLISREQGDFLTILTRALNVRCAVEVGTFTGYSAICFARGLAPGGRLYCFDQNEGWAAIARRYWTKGELSDRIEIALGDAALILPSWQPPHPIDLAFIDADKPGYDRYYELLLPKMKPNGLFLFDNMVWDGRIVEEPITEENGIALHRLNEKLARDPRVESVLLPLADGLQVVRKR